ncbi:ParB/RepB/Spo0J family partition protein [Hymenobacter sp.]|uniref:ParB/RepB/Spo0J family partition protein n=1 Tax=Hymenobacter sp. TaxID=1898978 RepID=UPI00286A351F|nr:ParB/RepB/Spo0J family partition protein [Hymenobacter sp.]
MAKRAANRISPPISPAPVLEAAAGQHALQYVPLASIDVVRNTRQHYDEPAMLELIQSIRAHGVMQSVTLRPHPEAPGRYQLAAGHRRFFAAQRAELTEIPAGIRPLTDRQFLEVQLLENLQREKVHPADEAVAFDELLTSGQGYTAEEIGLLVGKPPRFVAQRAQLVQLVPAWQEALREGRLPLGGAHALARLAAEHQEQAQTQLNQGYHADWVEIGGVRKRTYDTAGVRRWVKDSLSRNLATAAFPKDDPDLFPVAGACTTCPKRTGNCLYLFQDMGTDRCLDAGCFETKRNNFLERQLALIEQTLDGGPVLRITDEWGNRRPGVLNRYDYQLVAEETEIAPEVLESGRFRQAIVMDGHQAGQLVHVLVKAELAQAADPVGARQAQEAAEKEKSRQEKAATVAKNRQMNRAYQKLQEGIQAVPALRDAVLIEVLVQQLEYTLTKAKRQVLQQVYNWPDELFGQGGSYSTERKQAIARQVAAMPTTQLLPMLLDMWLVGWHTSEYDSHIPKLAAAQGWTPELLDAEVAEAKARRLADKPMVEMSEEELDAKLAATVKRLDAQAAGKGVPGA